MIVVGFYLPISGAASASTESGGDLYAWGTTPADVAALGYGPTPALWSPLGGTTVVAVASGDNHVVAVTSHGDVKAWGINTSGQLGDATTTNRTTPVLVDLSLLGPGVTVDLVAAGAGHSLLLTSDGTVAATGDNGWGQLGDGTTADRATPVQVAGLTDVVAIAAGQRHSLAVKNDGTVWAWGDNGRGQLGDGTTTDRATPVQVAGLTDVVAIVAGESHSLAVKNDGTVWAWGNNDDGRLGDGTNTDRTAPVQVQNLTDATAVASGRDFSLAVDGDGSVWAWGSNAFMQLGDGTGNDRLAPVEVPGLDNVTAISAGETTGFAVVGPEADTNAPPVADAGGPYVGNEGAPITLSGATATDDDGDPLALLWTVDAAATCSFDDATILNPELTCDDDGAFTVTLTADDGTAAPVGDAAPVTVTNVAPTITAVTGPTATNTPGALIAVHVSWTDPGTADTFDVTFDWGDGSSTTDLGATSPVTGVVDYAVPGIYTVTVTVTDSDGGAATQTLDPVVVVDPDGRRVTGSARVDDGGDLRFRMANERDGSTVGRLEFEAGAASDIALEADGFDHAWILGHWAVAAGTGYLDDGRAVEWLLTVVDGKLTEPSGPDLFRIKIWEAGAPSVVLYDTEPGAGDFDPPTRAIDMGNVKIKVK